jgi:hypothetical protein
MPHFRQLATWNFRPVCAFALSGLLALSGCAYHMGYGDRQVPGGYRTVAVPVFKNISHEAGIEVYFTNAFVREMQRERVGTITDKANAQVTLEGTIDQVTYASGSPILGTGFGPAGNGYPNGTVLNSAVRIGVATTLRLRRNSDQKILWEGSFTREQSYSTPRIGYEALSGANALYDHSARYQNIEALATDMMSEAHDRLTENF